MKRFLRLALCAALLLACVPAGVAEEEWVEAVAEIEAAVNSADAVAADAAAETAEAVSGRIDFTEDIAPFEGRWVTFDDGFKLYLPVEWTRSGLTEVQERAGLFYRASNGGGDSVVGNVAMGVAVSYVRAGSLVTLDDLAEDFSNVGFTGIDKLDINGIPVVTFNRAAGDYRGVAFYHSVWPNYVMTVYVSPGGADDQTISDVGSAILCSLSPQETRVGQ